MLFNAFNTLSTIYYFIITTQLNTAMIIYYAFIIIFEFYSILHLYHEKTNGVEKIDFFHSLGISGKKLVPRFIYSMFLHHIILLGNHMLYCKN